MIHIKTPQDLEIMKRCGKILAEVLWKVLEAARPGVAELELDKLAEKLIRERNAAPGFQKVEGYKHTICISTNNVVVHGVPTHYRLQEGDIVGIDCGVYLEGFHTDMAETIQVKSEKLKVKNEDQEIKKFLETGKKALEEGISQARLGNHVGHVSQAIQTVVEGGGYSVVRSLIGHGVGSELHEEPEVPGFLHSDIEKTPLLKPGMTIAVEVIYNMGKPDVTYVRGDDWTIATADGSLSGLFERTIAITESEPILLTR